MAELLAAQALMDMFCGNPRQPAGSTTGTLKGLTVGSPRPMVAQAEPCSESDNDTEVEQPQVTVAAVVETVTPKATRHPRLKRHLKIMVKEPPPFDAPISTSSIKLLSCH